MACRRFSNASSDDRLTQNNVSPNCPLSIPTHITRLAKIREQRRVAAADLRSSLITISCSPSLNPSLPPTPTRTRASCHLFPSLFASRRPSPPPPPSPSPSSFSSYTIIVVHRRYSPEVARALPCVSPTSDQSTKEDCGGAARVCFLIRMSYTLRVLRLSSSSSSLMCGPNCIAFRAPPSFLPSFLLLLLLPFGNM